MITSLGEKGAGLCASRAFALFCFVRASNCPFSLPLGVGGWLWFVMVALPGFSVNFYDKTHRSEIEFKKHMSRDMTKPTK